MRHRWVLPVAVLAACAGDPAPPTGAPSNAVALRFAGGALVLDHRGATTPLALSARRADGTAVELPWDRFAPLPSGARGATVDGVGVEVSVTPSALRWSLRASIPLRGIELRLADLPLRDAPRAVVDGAQSWSFAGPIAPAVNAALATDAQGNPRFPETLGDALADLPTTSLFHGELAGDLSLCADDGDGRNTRWSAVTFERPGDALRVRVFDGLIPDDATRAAPSGAHARGGRITVAAAVPGEPFACVPRPASARAVAPFPRGWWSWNTLFSRITAATVDPQVRAMAALDPAARHVTLDDGWELRWGDWQPSPAFGGTIADVARSLHARGYTLGLWLAPFAVDPASPLTAAHPDWLLRRADGGVLTADLVPGRTFAILDATHPAARAHVTSVIAGLRAAGVDLFKVDFLYAAALPAVRRDPSATGLQAYTLGMQAIAEGAGGAHVNGCGAVLAATLPYVQSVRVGADNTFDRVTPGWGSVLAIARNLSARRWVLAQGVALDPDQPVTRELTLDEARAFLAVTAMTGAFGYGDDLTDLSAARAGLYAEPWFTALRDLPTARAAGALDAAEDPSRVFLPSPLGDLVGAFRASPRARTPTVFTARSGAATLHVLLHGDPDARTIRLPRSGMSARELVTDTAARAEGDAWVVEVPPHAVRVLRAE